jgi:hypothetical protein
MSATKFDIRQSETRVLQDQLNSAATTQMDSTLASINSELTSPGRLIAQSTPSLVVTVGAGTVTNPNTGKNRALPPINNTTVSFAGGTITFPSGSGGGTITVSPGINGSITIGANQFAAVLVQLDASGNINLVTGSNAGSLGAVVVPGGSTTMLSLGYIIVQSNGFSIIQSVTNAMIYQFVGGGGGGSSSSIGSVGDIQESMLTLAQFQAQPGRGPGWVLADGSNCTGSAYALITGNTNLPDLRGVFRRAKNNGRSDGNQNPAGDLALGTFQSDQIASHLHSISDPGHFHDAHIGNTTSGSDNRFAQVVSSSGASNVVTRNNVDANSGIVANTTGITATNAFGASETSPKAVTVNVFIRIN